MNLDVNQIVGEINLKMKQNRQRKQQIEINIIKSLNR